MAEYAEWIQLGGLSLGVGTLSFVLLSLVLRRPKTEEERFPPENDGKESAKNLVLGEYTTAFADYVPAQKNNLTELHNELRSAGYYHPAAIVEYKAIRNLLVLVTFLITAIIALLVPADKMLPVIIGGIIAVGLGFSLPRVFLAIRSRSRGRAIERGLPLTIDMLILCLSAGQSLMASLLQTARQIRKTNPVLAQELTIAHQQAELHSLAFAMQQWSDRVKLAEVRNLVMVLIQSEKLGSDAAATLNELATNFRTTARQRAEAQANRTSFWMLFPSVFCFWIASAIVLIGPAYLEFTQYQQRSLQMIKDSGQKIKNATNMNAPGTTNSPGTQNPSAPSESSAIP